MMLLLWQVTQEAPAWPAADGGGLWRGFGSLVLVIGLILLSGWLVRRGSFGALGLPGARGRAPFSVEGAIQLGDRRSLVIVSVEGRRLLLGLTPASISLVAELAAAQAGGFARALDHHTGVSRVEP